MTLILLGVLLTAGAAICAFAFAFTYQLCRARDFASHPEQRMLPAKMWEIFAARLFRKLRKWFYVWAAMILICLTTGFIRVVNDHTPAFVAANWMITYAALPLIVWFGLMAGCFFLAPHVKSPAMLLLISFGVCIAIIAFELLAGAAIIKIGAPRWLFEYNYEIYPAGQPNSRRAYGVTFSFYYMLLFHAALAWWSVRRAKSKGDAWFLAAE